MNLTGYDVTKTYFVPVFADHVPRHAIFLVIQGPLGCYDAFVFVPHAFDLFGGGVHGYSADQIGSASISSQTLFVSEGSFGPQVTAGATSFGAGTASINALGEPSTGAQPAMGASPGTTVTGAPMSVAQAQALNDRLNSGGSSGATSDPMFGVGTIVVVAAIAVAVIVATVALVQWRANERRRSNQSPVQPFGTSGSSSAPPAAGTGPAGATGPSASAPSAPEEPQNQR